jgi:hypothetical protein
MKSDAPMVFELQSRSSPNCYAFGNASNVSVLRTASHMWLDP